MKCYCGGIIVAVITHSIRSTTGKVIQTEIREEAHTQYPIPSARLSFKDSIETYYCQDCNIQYYYPQQGV